jgi:predicted TIM-barrel fold metal-dependent hydrolase
MDGKIHRQDSGSRYIDAHVHVWSPDTERYPLAPGFGPQGMKPASFTPEQLLAHCRPEGVSRVVLIQMSFYGRDNQYMLDSIAAHPGVFSGVAIVDENAPRLRERMRALREKGVRGFRIVPPRENADAWFGSREMSRMWKIAADEQLNICPLINPEALPALENMSSRYPATPVVIDHIARIGMATPIRQEDLNRLLNLSGRPRVHVKVSAFYALGNKTAPYLDLAPVIRQLRDAFGPERLMWASDCPFQLDPGHTYRDSIGLIRDRMDFLTAADRTWLLRKTAETVFFD